MVKDPRKQTKVGLKKMVVVRDRVEARAAVVVKERRVSR
jgi:hypothetical protein